jgi:AcrR family transcriptional regulator
MSVPGSTGPATRRGYHHGNLRDALVEAARCLAAERGPHGFTLAEAARLAGVSPSAPYRHFRDRDALMAELSRRGVAAFAARVGKAAAEGGLAAMGPAHLAFAREEPGYYGAIFAWRDQMPPAEPGEGALAALVAALAPAVTPGDGAAARLLALQVWALSHGLAGLERAGMPARADAPTPEQVLADAVGKLVRGSA